MPDSGVILLKRRGGKEAPTKFSTNNKKGGYRT